MISSVDRTQSFVIESERLDSLPRELANQRTVAKWYPSGTMTKFCKGPILHNQPALTKFGKRRNIPLIR